MGAIHSFFSTRPKKKTGIEFLLALLMDPLPNVALKSVGDHETRTNSAQKAT